MIKKKINCPFLIFFINRKALHWDFGFQFICHVIEISLYYILLLQLRAIDVDYSYMCYLND